MTQEQPTTETLPVHIRWMIRRDLAEVIAIEAACFAQAWTENDFLRCLSKKNVIGIVAERGNKVIAFLVYELRPNRLRILNMAVTPDCQRRNVGTQLVDNLIRKRYGRRKVDTIISERNLEAQLFFKCQGFWAVKVLRDYYDEGPLRGDGYRMEWEHEEE